MGSLKKNTTLEYSTRVVREGDRRCKKSTLNDLAYLTPLRIPLMNPVFVAGEDQGRTDSTGGEGDGGSIFWKTIEIGLPSYSKICTL